MEELKPIIEKAIQGGWKDPEFKVSNLSGKPSKITEKLEGIAFKSYLLEPTFWQALGKSCSWTDKDCCKRCGYNAYCHKLLDEKTSTWGNTSPCGGISNFLPNNWEYHALRFHEINLTQGMSAAITHLKEVCNL